MSEIEKPYKEITIRVHKQRNLNGMIEIKSEDYPIHYTALTENGHHGLQASWPGDTPEHTQLLQLCSGIEKLTRQIDKLHE